MWTTINQRVQSERQLEIESEGCPLHYCCSGVDTMLCRYRQWLFSSSCSRFSRVLKPSRPRGVRLVLPAATNPERERIKNMLSLMVRGFLASDRLHIWQVAGTALYLGSCQISNRSDCGCARSGCFPRAGSPGVYFLLAMLNP